MTTPTTPDAAVETITPTPLGDQQLAARALDAHYIKGEVTDGNEAIRKQVAAAMAATYAATGHDRMKVTIDGHVAATFTLAVPTDSITVPDDALLAYAEDAYGEVVIETVVRVRHANAKQIRDALTVRTNVIVDPHGLVVTHTPDGAPIATDDGQAYHPTTGAELPGHVVHDSAIVDTIKNRVVPGAIVNPAPAPSSFRVTWAKPTKTGGADGRALAAAHVDGRLVNDFAAAGITAAAL